MGETGSGVVAAATPLGEKSGVEGVGTATSTCRGDAAVDCKEIKDQPR